MLKRIYKSKVFLALVILAFLAATPLFVMASINNPSITITSPTETNISYIRTNTDNPDDRTVTGSYDIKINDIDEDVQVQIVIVSGESDYSEIATQTFTPTEQTFSKDFSVTASVYATDGLYDVYIQFRQSEDENWVFATSTGSIMVDNTPPTAPGKPAVDTNPNNGTHTVIWEEATDPSSEPMGSTVQGVASGVSHYQLERHTADKTWEVVTKTRHISHDIIELDEGTYAYRVLAIDKAGNVSEYSEVSNRIVVDKTNPTSTITSPADLSEHTIGEAIEITGTATDPISNDVASGIDSVSLHLSYGDRTTFLSVTGTTSWSASWTPTTTGTYTLTSIATDKAGNVQTDTQTFTIEVIDAAQQDPPDDPDPEDPEDSSPAAPAIATRILKEAGKPNRDKDTRTNYVSEVAKQMGQGASFKAPNGEYIPKTDTDAYENAVREFLKTLPGLEDL